MSMQVNIDADLAILYLLRNSLLNGPNCWLFLLARVDIVTIQILCQCIQPIVSSVNAIWIEHRDYFEDETVPKYLCLLIVFICKELPDTVENERRRGFARMYSRGNENCWFVELVWPLVSLASCIWEKAFH